MRKEEKNLRCALLNGSAWSTERKYMRRYQGTFDVFFGIEHRLRKEEMEEQFNREAKEGWSFAVQQESLVKEGAVRIERTHKKEFLWQSTAIWEQLWEQKKVRLSRSQEELPEHG